MNQELLYLGLDVHAENIAVAIAEAGRDGEVRNHGVISSDLQNVEKVLRRLGHPHKELRVCYEAGPCGFDSAAPAASPLGGSLRLSVSRLPPPLGCAGATLEAVGHRLRGRRPLAHTEGLGRQDQDRPS